MLKITSTADFVLFLKSYCNFSFIKINHGFWEAIGDVYSDVGRPVPPDRYTEADLIAGRPYFFEGGFVDDFLSLIKDAILDFDATLFCGFELSAWPNDNKIIGTPFAPSRSLSVVQEYSSLCKNRVDGLILKKAVMDGSILEIFKAIRDMFVILVGPIYIKPLIKAAKFSNAAFIPIHVKEARRNRNEIEDKICDYIDQQSDKEICVLIQAGTLAPYWILRLRKRYPKVRWIDGGLAFSIASPDDLLKRPWGKVYRQEILTTYAKLEGVTSLPLRNLRPDIAEKFNAFTCEKSASRPVDFVENKHVDLNRAAQFLEVSRTRNRWANRGPVWDLLSLAYKHFFNLPNSHVVVPCSNGGIALAALAALHAAKLGRPARWVVSAFGFYNTINGCFADAKVIDCDSKGMLSLEDLDSLDKDTYDGFIVTNPYGLADNFHEYTSFAQKYKKIFLLDNASGVKQDLPDVSYQAFSLHQTKPFGLGEGGLAVLPADEQALFLKLIEYSPLEPLMRPFWVANGKISDIACATLLARLENSPEWGPLYQMQSIRITQKALRVGLTSLFPSQQNVIATSLPFLSSRKIDVKELQNEYFCIGKFYKPLAPLKNVSHIYGRLINIPSHPDMKNVETDILCDVLKKLAS